MFQMKNKTVINTSHNSAILLPTSGNRARNTLSSQAANLRELNLRHRSNVRYHCRDAIVLPAKRPRASDKCSLPPCPAV